MGELVGDLPPDSNTIEVHEEPIKAKLLLHPLRNGDLKFNEVVFTKALAQRAQESRRWSMKTAVNATVFRSGTLDPHRYPSQKSREDLMEDLRKRWDKPPICTSVVIMVWQKYFELAFPGDTDRAVQHILRWMPLLSDKALP